MQLLKIIIEKNVLTADKVYISDNLHGYRDITIPIKCQSIVQNGEVCYRRGNMDWRKCLYFGDYNW